MNLVYTTQGVSENAHNVMSASFITMFYHSYAGRLYLHLQSFQWMSKVLQAVDTIHQVGIYCLALVPPNYLPRSALGGIHIHDTMKKLQDGSLHPANVLMCPHTCVLNLPQVRTIPFM